MFFSKSSLYILFSILIIFIFLRAYDYNKQRSKFDHDNYEVYTIPVKKCPNQFMMGFKLSCLLALSTFICMLEIYKL